MELALIYRRQRDALVLLGVECQLGSDCRVLAVGIGGESIRIIRDEVLIHPVSALAFIGKVGELLLGIVDELLSVGCTRLRSRCRRMTFLGCTFFGSGVALRRQHS